MSSVGSELIDIMEDQNCHEAIPMTDDEKIIAMPVRGLIDSRVVELDGLRGLAALLVGLHHFGQIFIPNPSLSVRIIHRILEGFWVGVDIFFVLSGYLITCRLLQLKNSSQNPVRDFYLGRMLRIFPVYFFSLFILLLFLPYVFPHDPFSSSGYGVKSLALWTFTSNIITAIHGSFSFTTAEGKVLDHFWSLAIEEQFYLLWPFFILFTPRIKYLTCSGILVTIALALRITFWGLGKDFHLATYIFTFCRMDQLIMGGVLAIYLSYTTKLPEKAHVLLLEILLILTLAAIWLGNKCHWTFDFEVPTFGLTLVGALITCMIYEIHTKNKLLHGLLSSRYLKYLGKISFSFYIWQSVIDGYLKYAGLDLLIQQYTHTGLWILTMYCIFALATSVVIARFTFYLVEQPFQRLKKRMLPN